MSLPNNVRVGLLERVILIQNVLTCSDAENDAEQTVKELVRKLKNNNEKISRQAMESALYCCNMKNEDDSFWHPFKKSFRGFVLDLSQDNWWFDEYYNLMRGNDEKKEVKRGRFTKARG